MSTAANTYLDRKLAQACTYTGCAAAPAPGVQLCPKHRRRLNRARKRSQNALRAARRKAGQCAECPTKSSTYYCVRHAIAAKRTRRVAVLNSEDKQSRIAARTIIGVDGRTRYHGQRRTGDLPRAVLDEQSIDECLRLLVMTKQGLAMARAAVGLSKVQLRAALHAALAHGDRAAREFEALALRNGYTQQMLVVDDE